MRNGGRGRAAAIAVVGIALAARLAYLIRRPLWFDEIFTLWLSRRSPREIVEALRLDSGPPLFYFLEKPFVAAAEVLRTDSIARVLPFMALAAIFFACAGRRTTGRNRFVLLVAASPTLFFYSAEARAYAIVAALGFLLFLSVFRSRPGIRATVGAAITAGLLPWTHYLGVLVVAGSILLCLVRRKFRIALVQAAAFLPFLLWIPTALTQPRAAMAWSEERFWSSLERALGIFAGWADPAPYFTVFRLPATALGALLGATLLAGTVLAARRDRAVRDALCFAAIPILAAASVGVSRPIYFAGRTEMAVLPIALWAFARAARRSGGVRILTSATIAIGGLTIAAAIRNPPPSPPYAVTANFVTDSAQPGDVVVSSDADYLPLRLAADRGRLIAPLAGVPREIEDHPGWFTPGSIVDPASEVRRLTALVGRAGPRGRLIAAVPPDPGVRNLVGRFVEGRQTTAVRPPGGETVLILEAAAAGSGRSVP